MVQPELANKTIIAIRKYPNNCLFSPPFVKKGQKVGFLRGITLDLSKIIFKNWSTRD